MPPDQDEIQKIQDATISDEMISEARSLIGVWLRRDVHWPAISEPVSQQDIRRWALYSVGDDNPLFSDSEYARRTIWGTIIAPPSFPFTFDTTIVAPGLRGVQWILGGSSWNFFHPIRVGDQIVARARLTDVIEKSGERVPRFVIQRGQVIYSTVKGDVVATAATDILRIPRSGSGQGMQRKNGETTQEERQVRYTAGQIEEIRLAYLNESRRGAEVRYWDDANPGDDLPRVVKGPLTLVDLVAFYAGRRSVYNPLKLAFLEREKHPANVYISPETGIPVHPAAGHFDSEIARRVGFASAYDNGWMRVAWAGHLLTNWASDWGFVRRLSVRLTRPVLVGDVLWLAGKVSDKSIEGEEHLVHVDCTGTNQKGEVTMTAKAVVRLPSRSMQDAYLIPTTASRPEIL